MSTSETKNQTIETADGPLHVTDVIDCITKTALEQGSSLYTKIKKLKKANGGKSLVIVNTNIQRFQLKGGEFTVSFNFSRNLDPALYEKYKDLSHSKYPNVDHDEKSLAFLLCIQAGAKMILYPITFNSIIESERNKTKVHDLFTCFVCKKEILSSIDCSTIKKCTYKYCSEKCRTLHIDHECITSRCFSCNKIVKSGQCSICKTAKYCSLECQKVHWKIHRLECEKLKEIKLAEEEFELKMKSQEEEKVPISK